MSEEILHIDRHGFVLLVDQTDLGVEITSEVYGSPERDTGGGWYRFGLVLEPDQRQKILWHLLEAEAAERVEVCEGPHKSIGLFKLGKDEVYLYDTGRIVLRTVAFETFDTILCLAAALAEKRKREGQV